MQEVGFTFSTTGPENRQISINATEFFKGIGKAIIKTVSGNYADALTELPDVAASLGFKASPQERVGALILRALERSLIILVAERAKEENAITPDVYAASFLGLSENLTFEVDRIFFENPNATGLVDFLIPDANKWLTLIGVPEADIKNILIRLPSVFSRALHDEWRSNATFYCEILEFTDSPFVGAAVMEQEWARYRAYLVSISDERVFDESFGLRQIYITPRCYFYDKNNRLESEQRFTSRRGRQDEPMKVLRWADVEIKSWIERKDRDFSVRTVAGGPGSGKSSFAKIIASDLALLNRRVLFVPLHQIDLELGIAHAISDYFRQTGHFSNDPLAIDANETTILILDGLDEIQMQGRAAQEAAQNFVNDLIRYVDRKNTSSCKLLCLITGRDLAIQSAEGALKIEGQVLHLAPYAMQSEDQPTFNDAHNLFDIDQRNEWWKKYGILTGASYEKMPNSLRKGELNEVTSQPLLNYLVSLAYKRGIKLDESTNVNSVYEDLLKAVYARAWARHSHPSVKDVSYEAFVRLLEEVALAVWHGAGRTATLNEVETHCQQSKLGALLPSFQSGISSGVSSLLLAFYFRQKGRRDDGSKTFEFTHKTFAEYLISLRVVRLIEAISDKMHAHNSDPDFGIDEKDALHRWLNICGKTALDSYLLDFIRREIAFRSADRASTLQNSLCILFDAALRSAWPVERITKLNFVEQQSYIRNAEETLLACLNACALVSKKVSNVRWPSDTSLGEMVSRLQGQRKGPRNRPVMSCLSFLNYDDQCLDMADLYKAEMHNSSFARTDLYFTMLMSANLEKSSFENSNIDRANIDSAVLKEAKFTFDQIVWNRSIFRRGVTLSDELESIGIKNRDGIRKRVDFLTKREVIVVDENGKIMTREDIIREAELRARKKGSIKKS